jgi:hypothetical protein
MHTETDHRSTPVLEASFLFVWPHLLVCLRFPTWKGAAKYDALNSDVIKKIFKTFLFFSYRGDE